MTRRMIAPLLFGVVGVAILLSLGIWQVQRLAWKNAILNEIGTRLAAEAVAIPSAPDPAVDAYRRVMADGVIEPGELDVYTSNPPQGVGYRAIVPLRLADGRLVLLDRGFVPIENKDDARLVGPIHVEGALVWPQETDFFTSEPDQEKNIWFARDVPLMAKALGTLPVMVVTETSDDPNGPTPMPLTVNIPNDHLQYAITWFLLAVVWAGMTGYLLWRIKRRID